MAIHDVKEAVLHYRSDHGDTCPRSLRELVDGGYLRRTPRDIWGQQLVYSFPSRHPVDCVDVISAGWDRRFGTADDVHSWDDD